MKTTCKMALHKEEYRAKVAQSLTKEQAELVLSALENGPQPCVVNECGQAVELYGGIPNKAKFINGLLTMCNNHDEATKIMEGL